MSKITRATHKTFGASGSSDNFAQFGSLVAGTPLKSKDIATIQALPAWDQGFQQAIYGANKDLLLEDLNAFCFEHSRQLAYLFQAGIAEWDSGTTYYKGSFVQRTNGGGDATGQLYQSLIDNNTGNAPPASGSNANWLWINPPQDLVGGAATLNTLPKVSNAASGNGTPGSVELADSAVSDDGVNVKIALPLKFADGTVQSTTAQPVTQQNSVLGSRAFGIVYRNTTGRPMFVAISVGSNSVDSFVYTDANPAPTTMVATQKTNTGSATMFFVVLPGNYYQLAGGTSLLAWTEWF